MNARVVVTGMGALSPLGHDWNTVLARLKSCKNAVQRIDEWDAYKGLHTRVGARVQRYELPSTGYDRKSMRSMGKVALMAVLASDAALQDAGLRDDPLLKSGRMGVSYGSSSGSPESVAEFGDMLMNKTTDAINATTYIKGMSHTAAVNIGVFFGMTGRIVPTSTACTSGSQGIGYAYEMVQSGKQLAMLAGGAEELDATAAAVFDTLFATSVKYNDTPSLTPRPFAADREGLVLGEGACTLVLENLEHAQARGAKIYAEVIGYGANSDGRHVTQPNWETMARAISLAMEDARVTPGDIPYVNAHGTATKHGDEAETRATNSVFGNRVAISSLKSYMGHTLGACGALEAWMSIEMMRSGWFAPTLNLGKVDPLCADLDYITGDGRQISTEIVMSNNFAFGGINTSLIFKRW